MQSRASYIVGGGWYFTLGVCAGLGLDPSPRGAISAKSVALAAVRAANAEGQLADQPNATRAFFEWMDRGDALQKRGESEAARSAFEAAGAQAVSSQDKAEARLRVALSYSGASEVAFSREHLERALKIPGLDAEMVSRIQLNLAKGHVTEYNSEAAVPLLEEIIARKNIVADLLSGALVLRAQIHARYGVGWAWEKVVADCESVLAAGGGLGEDAIGAHTLLSEASLAQRQFDAARRSMRWLVGNAGVPPVERARHQLALIRMMLGEGRAQQAVEEFPLARQLLAQSRRAVLDSGKPLADVEVLEARCELLQGLVWCETGKNSEARAVLARVAEMPGQTVNSPETREALLKMRLRGFLEDGGAVLKVLMVGSSLTIRGNIPLLLERMAASAPNGSPRILAGEHVRMGTGIRTFWAEGEAPDTVRYKIRTEPWDVVVVETFYRMSEPDIEQYVHLYSDLARRHGSRVVMYETPASKLVPYPAGFDSVHQANVNVAGRLGVPVAPGLWAWKRLLGAAPGKADFDRFYSDALHATLRGAYVNACSVYAAVTGSSPVGLFHPDEIKEQEARGLQTAAWDAYTETRRMTPPASGR